MAFLAAALLLAVPACSSGPDGGRPVAVAGDTAQGGRISLRPVAGGAAVRVRVTCGVGKQDTWVPLYDELRVRVGADGRFDEHRRVELADDEGGTIPIDVDLRGRFLEAGRAEGTVAATYRLGRPCRSGEVAWSAAQRIVEPPGPVAHRGRVLLLVPDGDDLLALEDGGALVRLDLRGGATDVTGVPDGQFVAFGETLAPDGAGGVWYPLRGRDGVTRAARHVAADGAVRDVVMPEALGERDIPVPRGVTDVVVAGGSTWLRTNSITQRPVWELRRVDGADVVPLRGNGTIAASGEHLWLEESGDVVLRDATSGAELRRVAVGDVLDLRPELRASSTMACVPLVPEDRLACVDVDGKLTRVHLPAPISGLAVDDTGAWVASDLERVVRRVELGGVVRTIDLPVGPRKLALDRQGRLWASTERGVERIA